MASVLTVNGTAYNQSARKTASLLVDSWGWDVDGDYSLEFHQHTAGPIALFSGPVPVSMTVGGTGVFTGDLVGVYPAWQETGRTWGYRCLGLKYRANWLPVVATDGSGYIHYNVPPVNYDQYIPAQAGLSIGAIIAAVLASHSTALTAAGITTDATTAASLAALTLVPSEQVDISGERLWQALEGALQRWARNIRLIILPSGLVRVVDCTTGSAHTLTVGTDPVDPPLFSRNWTNCATRLSVRGQGKIEPAYVSLTAGTLVPAWSGADELAWTMDDFERPGLAYDTGAVNSVDSATQVTVQSDDAARTWGTNFWSGVSAWIHLSKTAGSGLTWTESRPITACHSLSAAGTATVTLGYELANAGASDYDRYSIIGTNVGLADGGLSNVHRLYDVVTPGNYVEAHLVRNFPAEVAFVNVNGNSANLTTSPMCQVLRAGVGGPQPFSVDPVHGQVLFARPVVESFSTPAALALGGASVSAPDEIYMLLAYSRGALTATYPPDSGGPVYSGTASTVAGLHRTQVVDLYSWVYGGNSSVVLDLAIMLQQSVRDTVVEGTVTYRGHYTTCQSPAGGHVLNFAGVNYTTGDEALAIPVRSYSVRYVNELAGGLNYITTMRCSTRRDPRTGESYYGHLSQLGRPYAQIETVAGMGGLQQGTVAVQDGGTIFTANPDLSGLMGESGGQDGEHAMGGRSKAAKRERLGEHTAKESAAPMTEDELHQDALNVEDQAENSRRSQARQKSNLAATMHGIPEYGYGASPDIGPAATKRAADLAGKQGVGRAKKAARAARLAAKRPKTRRDDEMPGAPERSDTEEAG